MKKLESVTRGRGGGELWRRLFPNGKDRSQDLDEKVGKLYGHEKEGTGGTCHHREKQGERGGAERGEMKPPISKKDATDQRARKDYLRRQRDHEKEEKKGKKEPNQIVRRSKGASSAVKKRASVWKNERRR